MTKEYCQYCEHELYLKKTRKTPYYLRYHVIYNNENLVICNNCASRLRKYGSLEYRIRVPLTAEEKLANKKKSSKDWNARRTEFYRQKTERQKNMDPLELLEELGLK